MQKHAALVLAAGKGTRMHSSTPKVLQTLLGEPMLTYVFSALRPFFGQSVWSVVGHGADRVREAYGDASVRFVLQEEQRGTGHALQCALPSLVEEGVEYVLVVNGDTPLITTEFLEDFIRAAKGADVAFATMTLPQAGAYGRVVRRDARVIAIVEAKDYDAKIHGVESGEVNTGIYYIRIDILQALLPQLTCTNKSGEYYLTDIVALAVEGGHAVAGVCCGEDANLFGINTPRELASAEDILQTRINMQALDAGVIMHGVQGVRIGPLVRLEPGIEIFGPCDISGTSHICAGAVVHAYTMIHNSCIESGAQILPFSHLDGVHVGVDGRVGPYGRLRPGAILEEGARVGNFVEMKKAVLGKGAKASHLSYLGDAHVGEGANIGAGTITCNYDGVNKHTTHIGKNAFIGSNSALVAPVSIGDGALVGAGSVITKNVPEGQLGIGRAKQRVLPRKK